jgi:uncharacterized membrane protein YvbJ
MAICPKCGKENPEGAKFCMHCGEDLQKAEIKNMEKRLREIYPEKDAQRFANASGLSWTFKATTATRIRD